MMFRIDQFSGEIPKAYPTLLPRGAAQTATDATFERGVIEPLAQAAVMDTHTGTVVDFYCHSDGTLIYFDSERSVVPGPVATDRLYIAEAGEPPIIKLMPSGTEYDLAVPTPLAVPTVAIDTAAPAPGVDEDPLPVEVCVYVYTWVTTLDEESLPSSPSAAISVTEGSTVSVGFTDAPPTGSRVDRIRVYRSVTSASGAAGFYFVKELNSGATTYVHDVAADPPQELLPSENYDPPVSGIQGFTAMQNGIIAGFKGRDLYFCEPYIPHAWPRAYALQTDFDIVGLVAFGPHLAVLTEGQPYRVEGILPESMLMTRLDITAPCVSEASIVDMGYSAIYAGPDGLIEITAGGLPRNITEGVYTRSQWRALVPSTIHAGRFDTNYVFRFTDGAGQKTRMLQMEGAPHIVNVSQAVTRLHHDPTTNELLFSSGATVQKFSAPGEAPETVIWRSAPAIFTFDASFGVILVEGTAKTETPGIAIRVYVDETLIATLTSLNAAHRLPPKFGKRWEIEIEGEIDVFRLTLASEYDELIA